jgi:hypothetical protein
MSKRNSGEASFADAQTLEQWILALQKRLASGELTPTAEVRVVELIFEARGWTGKTPKSSSAATEPLAAAIPLPSEEPQW